MCEQRAARAHLGDVSERLIEVQMRRMWLEAERVENQHIQPAQLLQRFFRDQVAVGDKGDFALPIAKTKRGHIAAAMLDVDRRDAQAADFKLAFDYVRRDLRQPAADVLRLEDVIEHAAQIAPGAFTGVNRQRAVAEIERANVIEAEDVIGVGMRNKDRVEPMNARAQGLLAEISRDVYDQTLIVVFDHQTGAEPFVARIVRGAGRAIAAERGHADRGSSSEKGELHK